MIMIPISLLFGVLAEAAVTKQKVEKKEDLVGGQDMLCRL